MNRFCARTLEGNWYEDRHVPSDIDGAPLATVATSSRVLLASSEVREFETEHADAFSFRVATAVPARRALITRDTYAGALASRSASARREREHFAGVLPDRRASEHTMISTYRADIDAVGASRLPAVPSSAQRESRAAGVVTQRDPYISSNPLTHEGEEARLGKENEPNTPESAFDRHRSLKGDGYSAFKRSSAVILATLPSEQHLKKTGVSTWMDWQ